MDLRPCCGVMDHQLAITARSHNSSSGAVSRSKVVACGPAVMTGSKGSRYDVTSTVGQTMDRVTVGIRPAALTMDRGW
jgi:hypothetical protein